MPATRIYEAMLNAPGMEQSEVEVFLASSKIPLRLGTVDSKGDPMIHPVWFHYLNSRLYLMSAKDTRKVRNIRGKKSVYFPVDTDATPNRGVKGKGTAIIVRDTGKSVPISEENSRQISGRSQYFHGKESGGWSKEGLRGSDRDHSTLLLNLGLWQGEILDRFSRIGD